jgi:hypothetical protein
MMTVAVNDTNDIKIAWLVSLENMVIALSRLRSDFLTSCRPEPPGALFASTTASMTLALKEIAELRLRLMDTWGIRSDMVARWMGLGLSEYEKRMDPSRYIVLRSSGSRPGRTRKSPKSGRSK